MFEFKFADIGEGIHEGKLLKWFFEEGDEVKDGDNLFLVETDKVNAEIPSPITGKLSKKMASVGDVIEVGQVIAIIDDGNEADDSEQKAVEPKKEAVGEGEEETAGVVGQIEVSSEVIESSHEMKGKNDINKKKVLATPVARKLAKDLGIDITTVEGTGAVGRVMKEDIYKAKEALDTRANNKDVEAQEGEMKAKDEGEATYISPIKVPEMKFEGEVERVSISMLRKTVAKNMVLSKSLIPHAATMNDFDVTKLVQFRMEQKELAEKAGVHLTFMPFIIKAVAIALKEFPVFNASYDHEKEEVILKKFYNIGMAVDTPDGLMVPVIKDADQKGIFQIARTMEELKLETRNRSVSLEKLQNGTFTITNYGAIGGKYGVPVIKYPETAILGVGAIEKRPIVEDNQIVIKDMMPITLCIDHRVIDGGDAGRFLMRLEELLKDPMLVLLN